MDEADTRRRPRMHLQRRFASSLPILPPPPCPCKQPPDGSLLSCSLHSDLPLLLLLSLAPPEPPLRPPRPRRPAAGSALEPVSCSPKAISVALCLIFCTAALVCLQHRHHQHSMRRPSGMALRGSVALGSPLICIICSCHASTTLDLTERRHTERKRHARMEYMSALIDFERYARPFNYLVPEDPYYRSDEDGGAGRAQKPVARAHTHPRIHTRTDK